MRVGTAMGVRIVERIWVVVGGRIVEGVRVVMRIGDVRVRIVERVWVVVGDWVVVVREVDVEVDPPDGADIEEAAGAAELLSGQDDGEVSGV
jgi:hypothetical protein